METDKKETGQRRGEISDLKFLLLSLLFVIFIISYVTIKRRIYKQKH